MIFLKWLKIHPNNLILHAYYIKYRNKFTSILRARKINFYKLNFSSTITIPKLTWKLINNLIGDKNNIENNGQIINLQKDPLNTANISNLCFIGIGKGLVVKFKNHLHNYYDDKKSNFYFDQHFLKKNRKSEVLKIINNFKDKTAARFDKISVKLLKNIAPLLLML